MSGAAFRDWLARWRGWSWRGSQTGLLLSTTAGRVLTAAVMAIAALTLIGLVALWPYGWHACRLVGRVWDDPRHGQARLWMLPARQEARNSAAGWWSLSRVVKQRWE